MTTDTTSPSTPDAPPTTDDIRQFGCDILNACGVDPQMVESFVLTIDYKGSARLTTTSLVAVTDDDGRQRVRKTLTSWIPEVR